MLAYRDGRHWQRLGSAGVHEYIQTAIGSEFSAKDFRTWNATVLMALFLANAEPSPTAPSRKSSSSTRNGTTPGSTSASAGT